MKTRFLAVIDRKRKSPWFALGVNLMAMLAMTLVMRPSFETNDDIVFAEFGSGLRGVKTPRLVFQNYILGLVYRLLYQVTGRLPWYTIVQYAVLVAAFSAVTYVFMNRLKGYWGLYLSFILLWVFGYESYIHIQFTKTAGIAAAAAVLLLFHVITSEKILCLGDGGRFSSGTDRLYVQRGSVFCQQRADGRCWYLFYFYT
mgnify:CR=1 FL=1